MMMMIESKVNTNDFGNFFLLLHREPHELIVLRADQERNGRFVEAARLPIPLFYAISKKSSRKHTVIIAIEHRCANDTG
jgi:hypothetical protein